MNLPPPVIFDPAMLADLPPPPPPIDDSSVTMFERTNSLCASMSPFIPKSTSLSDFPYVAEPEKEFQMLERLGKGSFGAVYKALHLATNHVVAVKKMLAEDIEEALQEIDIMKECDLIQIVKYFGHFEQGDHLWIVMEYCGLGSISDAMLLSKKGRLTEDEIASVMRDCLLALSYMHETKKIHRDIKPDNILLNDEGMCKLADFGVAGKTSTVDKRSTLTGTPYYIAPEVLREDESGYDARADIWSLGVVALQFAQGYVPYAELPPMKVMLHIAKNPAPTVKNAAEYSPSLIGFLNACLVKEPSRRASAKALLQEEFIKRAKTPAVAMATIVGSTSKALRDAGGLENALRTARGKPPLQESKSQSAIGSPSFLPPPAVSNSSSHSPSPSPVPFSPPPAAAAPPSFSPVLLSNSPSPKSRSSSFASSPSLQPAMDNKEKRSSQKLSALILKKSSDEKKKEEKKEKKEKKEKEKRPKKSDEEESGIKKMLSRFLSSRPSKEDLTKKKILLTMYDDDYYNSSSSPSKSKRK
ncbi:hypothetical protein PROFUN_06278 [Planoprotostelium fungivorum]|uniref:non-specific serine/threonine protein kinase n=1 Tax=Planoprotostelium fungivorum TaxID=1890364 RepID=A0A2P6NE79_9EUKA|nr:hypothetical protein PROFUN_06278 [Planoprotostelium fungivorum]